MPNGSPWSMFASLRDRHIYTPNRTWRCWRVRSTQEDKAVQTQLRQATPKAAVLQIAQSIDSLVFAKFELKLCVLDFFNEKSDILQSSCHALICCEEITFRTRHSIKFSSKSSFRLSVLNHTHTHTHIPYQLPIYPYALKRTLFACRCGLLFSGDVLLVECGISPKVHLVEDFVHK